MSSRIIYWSEAAASCSLFTTNAFFDGLLNGLAHLKTTFGTVSKSKESVEIFIHCYLLSMQPFNKRIDNPRELIAIPKKQISLSYRSHRGHKPHRLSGIRWHYYRHQAIQRLPIQTTQTPAFATDLSSDQRVGGSSPSERARFTK